MIENEFVKIKKNQSISEVYQNLEKKKFFFKDARIAISFKTDGSINGILTLGDLRRHIVKDSKKIASSVFNKKPIIFRVQNEQNYINQSKILEKIFTKEIDDIIILSKKSKI